MQQAMSIPSFTRIAPHACNQHADVGLRATPRQGPNKGFMPSLSSPFDDFVQMYGSARHSPYAAVLSLDISRNIRRLHTGRGR
jgi:hypothetical protein